MKRSTLTLIAAVCFAFTGTVMAQSKTAPVFTPTANSASALAPVKIAEKSMIVAYLLSGKLNETTAFGLSFHNNSAAPLSFSWTVKDQDGKVIASSTTTVGGGQTIYPMNAGADPNLSFAANGHKVSDYTIDMNFK